MTIYFYRPSETEPFEQRSTSNLARRLSADLRALERVTVHVVAGLDIRAVFYHIPNPPELSEMLKHVEEIAEKEPLPGTLISVFFLDGKTWTIQETELRVCSLL